MDDKKMFQIKIFWISEQHFGFMKRIKFSNYGKGVGAIIYYKCFSRR